MSGQNSPEPRRNRKRADRSDIPLSFLPQNNPRAKVAYVSALIGLVPIVGLLLGPVAVTYGWLGFRCAKGECNGNGIGHAFVSMVLGGLETVASAAGLFLVGRGLDWL